MMSIVTIASITLFGLAVLCALTGIIMVVVRLMRVRARIKVLANHPMLQTLQRASRLSEQSTDLPARLALISARVERIGLNVGELLAASALLRADVMRIGRTTERLLDTFVPAMRRSF